MIVRFLRTSSTMPSVLHGYDQFSFVVDDGSGRPMACVVRADQFERDPEAAYSKVWDEIEKLIDQRLRGRR